MRERWARLLAFTTGRLVLLLSAAFAAIQNPAATPAEAEPAAAADAASSERLARGRAVLEANDCLRCHSIAGAGSPRSPLDGVGARVPRAELHDWVIASDAVKDELSPRAATAKAAYRELPAEDMEALLDYLASLTD